MSRSLFIFRQDLRVYDNHGLWQTVQSSQENNGEVFPVFIFDTNILSKFPNQDPRLGFLSDALRQLDRELEEKGSFLTVFYGDSIEIIQSLVHDLQIDTIARNRSYGDNSLTRDRAITARANTQGITTKSYSDYLLVEPEEVIPMKVFTPFKNRWLKELATKDYSKPYLIDTITTPNFSQTDISFPMYQGEHLISSEITKKSIGYDAIVWPIDGRQERLSRDYSEYDETRNIPSIDGTTRFSPYTRFGLVSIREIYRNIVIARNKVIHDKDKESYTTVISELARREFWQSIAHYFPEARIMEFQEKRRKLKRDNNTELFAARCEGRTGYPMVDAGMRQLVQEKRMHNRVRMVVASFLTKDLLVDRKRGEEFFAQHLIDYDANVNIGNRQRSASVGADPKPIRIFSPLLQSFRFDREAFYIKKYIPELENIHPDKIHDPLKNDLTAYGYVNPIIDHYERSKKARAMYKGE